MSSRIESNSRYLLVENGFFEKCKKENDLFKKVKSFFSSFKPSLGCFDCSQNPRNPDKNQFREIDPAYLEVAFLDQNPRNPDKNQFREINPAYLEVAFLDQKHLKQGWEHSVSSRDLNRFSNDNIPSPQISKGKLQKSHRTESEIQGNNFSNHQKPSLGISLEQKNKSTDPEVEIFEV
jgi:hypothetical protein